MSNLTDKQERFCREYIIDLNGAQAAIRAGYAENSARVEASRLLSNDNIQDFVSELQAAKSNQLNITFEDVVNGVWEIAQNGEKDSDRLKAFDQVSKHLGFYEKDNTQKKTDIVLPTKIEFTKGARES